MADKLAVFRIGADASRLDGQLSTARSKLKRFGTDVKQSLSQSFHGAFEALREVSGFGQIGSLALIAHHFLDMDKAIAKLQSTSRASAAFMKGLRNEIGEVSAKVGVSDKEITRGLQAFVDGGGKIETAREALEAFAIASKATGTDIGELAGAAEDVSGLLGIAGKDFGKMFEILNKGSEGVGSLKQFQEAVANLAPQFKEMGLNGVDGLAKISAMLNVVSQDFKDPQEAASAMSGLIDNLQKHREELRKKGIKFFEVGPDAIRHPRELAALLKDIEKATGGDKGKLLELLGGKNPEAAKAALAIMRAQHGEMQKIVDEELKADELKGRASEVGGTPSGRIEGVKNFLERASTEHPIITGLTAALGPQMAKAAFRGIGGLFGKGKAGEALGGALEGAGVPHVWVDNMPGGGLGGALGGGSSGSREIDLLGGAGGGAGGGLVAKVLGGLGMASGAAAFGALAGGLNRAGAAVGEKSGAGGQLGGRLASLFGGMVVPGLGIGSALSDFDLLKGGGGGGAAQITPEGMKAIISAADSLRKLVTQLPQAMSVTIDRDANLAKAAENGRQQRSQ